MPPKAADAKAKPKPKKEPKKEKKEEAGGEAAEPEKPRVEAPDKAEFDAKFDEIKAKIESRQQELKAISSQIGERSHGKDEYNEKKAELRDAIANVSAKIGELKGKRDEIYGAMKQNTAAARAKNMELKDTKKKLGFENTEQIDERIAAIETKMLTETIPLKEEKQLLEEIKRLKKDKPKVSAYYQKEAEFHEGVKSNMADAGNMKSQLQMLNDEMSQQHEKKKELSEKLTTLVGSRTEQMGGMQHLFTQREKLNAEVKDLIKERDVIREEFNEKQREFYEYQRSLKEARQEKARAERELWKKEQEKKEQQSKIEKLNETPYAWKTTLLEQTIKFCKSFQPKEDNTQEKKKEIAYDNPETHVVLVSKKDRDEEFYYAPTKSKGPKGKTPKAAEVGPASKGSSKQPIKHSAGTFKLFVDLKVDAPITTDDIPATLEKLEKKMEKYKQKIKKREEQREEKKQAILAGEDVDVGTDSEPTDSDDQEEES